MFNKRNNRISKVMKFCCFLLLISLLSSNFLYFTTPVASADETNSAATSTEETARDVLPPTPTATTSEDNLSNTSTTTEDVVLDINPLEEILGDSSTSTPAETSTSSSPIVTDKNTSTSSEENLSTTTEETSSDSTLSVTTIESISTTTLEIKNEESTTTPKEITYIDFENDTYVLKLPENLSDPITLGDKQKTGNPKLQMRLLGVSSTTQAVQSEGTILYSDVFASTDIKYEMNAENLKESIILKDASHPSSFTYILNMDSYDFKQVSENKIQLFKKGHGGDNFFKVYTLTAPSMIDSNGNTSEKIVFKLEGNTLHVTPDESWLKAASYPVIVDPTIEISVLNVHSHPVTGEYWNVDFLTSGVADLTITPADQATVDDMQFTSLFCGGEDRMSGAQILSGDIIFYSDWSCEDVATISHLDLKTGNHHLTFEFSNSIETATSSGAFNASPSATPVSSTWVANGNINASAADANGIVYIQGAFDYVGPNNGHAVLLDKTTGAVSSSNFPKVNGTVYTIIDDGSGGWYIGGVFTEIGNTVRASLAHVLSNGTVDLTFDPQTSISTPPTVNDLVLIGSTLYVAGSFVSMGGQTRNRIAALDSTTGTATSWNPNSNGTIVDIVASSTTLYVGGNFTTIGGASRNRIAALDTTIDTNNAIAWDPNITGGIPRVYALALKDDVIYAGGTFTTVGVLSRTNLVAIDATTGLASAWAPNANGAVYDLLASSTTLYVGGIFTTTSASTRKGLASYDATTATAPVINAWDPTGASSIQVYTMALDGTSLYYGGWFTVTDGVDHFYLAAADTTTGDLTSWGPHADKDIQIITVSGQNVYVGGNTQSVGGVVRRSGWAAIDASTGQATSWDLVGSSFGTTVNVLRVDGTTLYAGGNFLSETINGVTRSYLAAIDIGTKEYTSWTPNPSSEVLAIAVKGSRVYVGGKFCDIGNTSLEYLCYLAALDKTTGNSIDAWDPEPDWNYYGYSGYVNSIQVSTDGNTVYVGGKFSEIGDTQGSGPGAPGALRNNIAAIDATTGSATAWNPGAGNPTSSEYVEAILLSGSTVYVGGWFNDAGGAVRNNLASLSTASNNALSFDPNSDGVVFDLALQDGTIYAGGNFTTIGGYSYPGFAAMDATTGTVENWNASAGENPWYGFSNREIYTITTSGGAVFIGGDFQAIGGDIDASDMSGGTQQLYFAQFGTYSAVAATIEFSSASASIAESVGTSNLTISLSAASTSNVTIDYTVSGGTATGGGTDYTLANGTLTILAGETSTSTPITIVDDSDVESSETIEVTLSNPSGDTTLGTNTVYTLTITDNDVAAPAEEETPTTSNSTSGGHRRGSTDSNTPDVGAISDPPWIPDYQENLTLAVQNILSPTEQCDQFESQPGWYGRYFDYPRTHPDMELSGNLWNKSLGDPLSKDKKWKTDWYDSQYFRFAKVTPNLEFGYHYFPFDYAPTEFTQGHDYFFGSEYASQVTTNKPSNYSFRLSSDDDSWLYIDGHLMIDNHGVHGAATKTGNVYLTGTHLVQIFFAERHTTNSHLYFTFTDPNFNLSYQAYNPSCDTPRDGQGENINDNNGPGDSKQNDDKNPPIVNPEDNSSPGIGLPSDQESGSPGNTDTSDNDSSGFNNAIIAPVQNVVNSIHAGAESLARRIPGGLTGVQQMDNVTASLAVTVIPVVQYGSLATQAANGIGSITDLWLIFQKFFYGLLALLGIRSRRKIWGTVYDSRTKQPIDPAIVDLIDANTGEIVDKAVTDMAGRYGFLVRPGIFKIQAAKTHYEFPSKLEMGDKDEIFDNLYHGETFEIKDTASVIVPNIPMDSLEFDWNQQDKLRVINFHPRLRFAGRIAVRALYYLGFGWSAFVFAAVPSMLNFIILTTYVAISLIIWLWPGVRMWGSVYNRLTNTSIGGVILEITHPELANVSFGKAKSESSGRFFLKGNQGHYVLSIKQPPSGESPETILTKTEVEIGKEGILNKDILV